MTTLAHAAGARRGVSDDRRTPRHAADDEHAVIRAARPDLALTSFVVKSAMISADSQEVRDGMLAADVCPSPRAVFPSLLDCVQCGDREVGSETGWGTGRSRG